jgi:hypothetical protein
VRANFICPTHRAVGGVDEDDGFGGGGTGHAGMKTMRGKPPAAIRATLHLCHVPLAPRLISARPEGIL